MTVVDPLGQVVWTGEFRIVDALTGRVVGPWHCEYLQAISPGGLFGAGISGDQQGIRLGRRRDNAEFVLLSGEGIPNGLPAFSQDGRYLAWANRNGAVHVADIIAVRERLRKAGLGW
jgi:hypothetical protein